MKEKSDALVIKSGTLEQIVEKLVFDCADEDDINAFCVVYRRFGRLSTIIYLIREFLEKKKSFIEEDVLAQKLDFFLSQHFIFARPIGDEIQLFKEIVNDYLPNSELRPKIQWIEHKNALSSTFGTLRSFFESGFSTSKRFFTINNFVDGYTRDGILFYSAEVLAQNLSLLERFILSKITPVQLLCHTKPKKAPFVAKFATHFNRIVLWIVSEILSAPDISKQLQILKKLIDVAQNLFDLHNYNGVMEILCALNKAEISKLKHLWNQLPSQSEEKLRTLEKNLDATGNYNSYRTLIDAAHSIVPVVPYLAVHLKYLTFADDSSEYYISNSDKINFEKIRNIGNIIVNLQKYQSKRYSFPVNTEAMNFLCNTWFLDYRDLIGCLAFHEPKRSLHFGRNSNDPNWKFDNEIISKILKHPNAPLTSESSSELFKICSYCFNSSNGVHVTDKIWRGQVMNECFSGIELVLVLINQSVCESRKFAKDIGQKFLKEGWIRHLGNTNSNEFLPRHDEFYQFVSEEISVPDKSDYEIAAKISNTEEQEDYYFYLAMTDKTHGGLQTERKWFNMESYNCISGKEIHEWCKKNVSRSDKIVKAFLKRIFSKKLLTQIVSIEEIPEKTITSLNEHYYYITKEHKKRLINISSSNSMMSPRNLSQIHDYNNNIGQTPKKKQGFTLTLKSALKVDQILSSYEIDTLTKMMDSEKGVEIESIIQFKHTSSGIFKGSSALQWLSKHDPEKGIEVAKSFYQRKIIRPYEHKNPIDYSDNLYVFGLKYLSYFKKEHGIIVTPRESKKPGYSTKNQGAGPILFERGIEAKNQGGGPILFERGGEIKNQDNTGQTPDTDRLWDTYKTLNLLATMCHPIFGIQRSSVRWNNTRYHLFSGKNFVAWLEKEKKMDNQEAIHTFEEFSQRKFISSLIDDKSVIFEPEHMYFFSIELPYSAQVKKEKRKSNQPLLPKLSKDDSSISVVELRGRRRKKRIPTETANIEILKEQIKSPNEAKLKRSNSLELGKN